MHVIHNLLSLSEVGVKIIERFQSKKFYKMLEGIFVTKKKNWQGITEGSNL